jgi:hypothetical protein
VSCTTVSVLVVSVDLAFGFPIGGVLGAQHVVLLMFRWEVSLISGWLHLLGCFAVVWSDKPWIGVHLESSIQSFTRLWGNRIGRGEMSCSGMSYVMGNFV